MTSRSSPILALLVCTAAFGQVSFDIQSPPCTYAFPIGCAAPGDAEGISFNGALTLDVPAFGAPGNCATFFSSPFGPGSVMMVNTACPASAGRTYFSAIDLTAGSYPGGWFFGLDISLPELVNARPSTAHVIP